MGRKAARRYWARRQKKRGIKIATIHKEPDDKPDLRLITQGFNWFLGQRNGQEETHGSLDEIADLVF